MYTSFVDCRHFLIALKFFCVKWVSFSLPSRTKYFLQHAFVKLLQSVYLNIHRCWIKGILWMQIELELNGLKCKFTWKCKALSFTDSFRPTLKTTQYVNWNTSRQEECSFLDINLQQGGYSSDVIWFILFLFIMPPRRWQPWPEALCYRVVRPYIRTFICPYIQVLVFFFFKTWCLGAAVAQVMERVVY